MRVPNPNLKHPFVRTHQRYPVLAAVLRALLEIPNVPVAAAYSYLRQLPDEKLVRMITRFVRLHRNMTKARAISSMQAVLDRADLTEAQWLELWEVNCRHVALVISEAICWERMPLAEAARCVTVEGEEHLRRALQAGRGAMIMGIHLGNLFSIPLAIHNLGLNLCIAGNAMPVRSIEERVETFLRGCGVRYALIGDDIPALAGRTFRRGEAVVTFVDFTLPETRNVWVRFGGAQTHVSYGPALLALRHKVPVLCMSSVRLEADRHHVTIHPPLPVTRNGDLRADASRLIQQAMDVAIVEIRQRPDQWWQWDFVPIRRQQPE